MASIEEYRPELPPIPVSTSEDQPWANSSLRSTLLFLLILAVFALLVISQEDPLPRWVLYGFAATIGIVLFFRSFMDAEWLLALVPLYIPLSKQYVVSLAPGINGTNILLMMLVLSWFILSLRDGQPMFKRLPKTRLVTVWAVLSCSSVVTLVFTQGGLSYLLEEVFVDYKAWLDQFVLFFVFVNLIRDGAMARRIALYMMLGALVVAVIGMQEMLGKLGLNTIEKSRLFGPQQQPNDFGAFLVYSAAPFVGLILVSIGNWRAWVILPYLAVVGKLLIMTFSRGAYLGLAVAGTMASYVRGKWFLILTTMLLMVALSIFPELIPESVLDRMSQTKVDNTYTENQLDKSSQSRLVLWDAAKKMSLENPLLGKGFGMFPVLKSQYTEREVVESDTHNMYLYISSQMGIPALISFLLILYATYKAGKSVYQGAEDRFTKAIGLGGVALATGTAVVNMFGSRMVNTEVSGYFWIYLAVLIHLLIEQQKTSNTRIDAQ
jgi:O-antigen ligase